MHTERLDLGTLVGRLKAEGPFTVVVDNRPHKIIAAQQLDSSLRPRNDWLFALSINADGHPNNNRVVALNNGDMNMAAGPYRLAVCYPLSFDDLAEMALSVHGRVGWRDLHRCVAWTVNSVWWYGLQPPQAEVDDLLHEVYVTPALLDHMRLGEQAAYMAWFAAGHDNGRLSHYLNLALHAKIAAHYAASAA